MKNSKLLIFLALSFSTNLPAEKETAFDHYRGWIRQTAEDFYTKIGSAERSKPFSPTYASNQEEVALRGLHKKSFSRLSTIMDPIVQVEKEEALKFINQGTTEQEKQLRKVAFLTAADECISRFNGMGKSLNRGLFFDSILGLGCLAVGGSISFLSSFFIAEKEGIDFDQTDSEQVKKLKKKRLIKKILKFGGLAAGVTGVLSILGMRSYFMSKAESCQKDSNGKYLSKRLPVNYTGKGGHNSRDDKTLAERLNPDKSSFSHVDIEKNGCRRSSNWGATNAPGGLRQVFFVSYHKKQGL